MPTATAPPLTRTAEERLRKPRTRGAFRPIDAAKRQLGLLQVADADGQAAVSWLLDLDQQRVEDARFLAFGSPWSHPAADAFTQLARGMTMNEACAIALPTIEAMLRDRPGEPACDAGPDGPLAFISDIQRRAMAALPLVRLLPKPVEKQVYQRKRKQDWSDADQAWLPLSLLKKIAAVDAVVKRVLADKAAAANHRVEGLHDDFRIVLIVGGVADEERETLALFVNSALKTLHPDLHAELAS
jgi:NifU-like protein involved in Fe-S cluster formation